MRLTYTYNTYNSVYTQSQYTYIHMWTFIVFCVGASKQKLYCIFHTTGMEHTVQWLVNTARWAVQKVSQIYLRNGLPQTVKTTHQETAQCTKQHNARNSTTHETAQCMNPPSKKLVRYHNRCYFHGTNISRIPYVSSIRDYIFTNLYRGKAV